MQQAAQPTQPTTQSPAGTTAADLDKVAVKFDSDKLRYDLMPVYPLQEIVKVLTVGAKKYEARNWEKGFVWGRVFAATMRHLWAWWGGEDNDPDDGLSHLAHAACNVIFLLEFMRTHRGQDDRVKMQDCHE